MNPLNNSSIRVEEPYLVREGVYGATINKDGESLFLRMELITEANSKDWGRFRNMTSWVANQNSRGVFSGLVNVAGEVNCPKYEEIQDVTGFTVEEYDAFMQKAVDKKTQTANKIVRLLEANSVGSGHMSTGYSPEKSNFVVYVSKNPDFSIHKANLICQMSLKSFIEAYKDVLVAVGSDFSDRDSFHNRGIFRNPYWVFEGKYSGLSMLLHGFTGVVADKFFPEKKTMQVVPVGSMQCILKKALLPGEGYAESGNTKIDITDLEVYESAPQGPMNLITIAALKRIYFLNN